MFSITANKSRILILLLGFLAILSRPFSFFVKGDAHLLSNLDLHIPDRAYHLPLIVFCPGSGNTAIYYTWLESVQSAVVVRLRSTFIDFSHDLNPMVASLRTALGDCVSDTVIFAAHSFGSALSYYSAVMAPDSTRVFLLLLAPHYIPSYFHHDFPILAAFGSEDCVSQPREAGLSRNNVMHIAASGGNHRYWANTRVTRPPTYFDNMSLADGCSSLSSEQQTSIGAYLVHAVVESLISYPSDEGSLKHLARAVNAHPLLSFVNKTTGISKCCIQKICGASCK